MRFFVIGGMNLDVIGFCAGRALMRDSNIGKIAFAAGGVGRNIACALADAGAQTELVTALSTRPEGGLLLADSLEHGIGLNYALRAEAPVSCYMAIHGDDGDMLLGVNDMLLARLITPEYISSLLPLINAADACVLDANLEEESLVYASKHITVPIAADAVSAAKCARLMQALPRLSLVKLNLLEARALSGKDECEAAAEALLGYGVRRVLISLGAEGVYAADALGRGKVRPTRVYNCQTSGAGDAMCAGAAIAMAAGASALECARAGVSSSERLLTQRCAYDLTGM